MLNYQELEIDELIMYEVRSNKIIKEQFYYKAPTSIK